MTSESKFSAMPAYDRSVEFGRAMAALDLTQRVVTGLESMYRRAGTGMQGSIYAIQAATHMGKTTAQRIFMIQKAEQLGGYTENVRPGENDLPTLPDVSYVAVPQADGSISYPVVRIEVHANPTISALTKHVARALTRGAEEVPKLGNLNDMTSFFTPYIRKYGVKLIIFDDVQEIGKVVGVRRNQAVVLFRTLCKTGFTQVACAGIDGTLEVLASDDQTANLTTKRHVFGPLCQPVWDGENRNIKDNAFIVFLSAMEQHLPFDQASNIHHRAIAEPMWEYCEGVIGLAKTLLQEATDYAIHRNYPNIDCKILSDVLKYELNLKDHLNPFFNPEYGGGTVLA